MISTSTRWWRNINGGNIGGGRIGVYRKVGFWSVFGGANFEPTVLVLSIAMQDTFEKANEFKIKARPSSHRKGVTVIRFSSSGGLMGIADDGGYLIVS